MNSILNTLIFFTSLWKYILSNILTSGLLQRSHFLRILCSITCVKSKIYPIYYCYPNTQSSLHALSLREQFHTSFSQVHYIHKKLHFFTMIKSLQTSPISKTASASLAPFPICQICWKTAIIGNQEILWQSSKRWWKLLKKNISVKALIQQHIGRLNWHHSFWNHSKIQMIPISTAASPYISLVSKL